MAGDSPSLISSLDLHAVFKGVSAASAYLPICLPSLASICSLLPSLHPSTGPRELGVVGAQILALAVEVSLWGRSQILILDKAASSYLTWERGTEKEHSWVTTPRDT